MDYSHFLEDEKREMIVANYKDSCMVEAGAGAGKTTIIIARVLKQLKEGFLKPEELVIITFTKAAAGELRDRLSTALTKEIEKENDEFYKKNLKYAIDNQSLIQVSTIHSFCFRLIKERALDINLPLDIMMMEEDENNARIEDFFNKWYRSYDKEEIKKLESEFYLRNYSKYVFNCFKEIAELPDEMVFKYHDELLNNPSVSVNDYLIKMKDQVKRFFDVVLDTLKNHGLTINNINDCYVARKGPLASDAFNVKDVINTKNKYIAIRAYKKVSCGEHFGESLLIEDKNGYRNKLTMAKAKIDDTALVNFINNEPNYSLELDYYQNALVVSLALKAREEYQKANKEAENKHVISNDALLQMALNLVKNEDALRHFQKEFKYIYVDEFQDTDTVQRDLVYTLSKSLDDSSKKFRDNCFFLVGDPKQSIYAFRGADLNVYLDTKNDLKDNNITNVFFYDLQRNHRSEGDIINWVNDEFKKEEGIGKDYLKMTFAHDGKKEDNVLNGVYTLSYPKEKAEFYKKKKDDFERESEFLVHLINKIKKDYKINTFERKDGKFVSSTREIKNEDFLILSPKKPELQIYADRLKEEGLAINLYGALDLETDPAVLRFKVLFHYLNNPNDKKAIYGAKEIFAQNIITKSNNEEANIRLEKFKNDCEGKKPHELLEYLAHNVRYFMDKNTNKTQVEYLESRLQQLLEYLLSQGILNANDYEAYIDKYINSGVDKELAIISGEDAIRLMNVHKSKGLEGKIVIVLARYGAMKNSNDSYRSMYTYYPSISSGGFGASISSYNPYSNIEIDPSLARLKERKRLEYVEATRAEEALIFFDALSSGCMFSDYDFSNTINLCDKDPDIFDLYKRTIENGEKIYNEDVDLNKKEIPEDNWNINIKDDQKKIKYLSKSPSNYELPFKEDWKPTSEIRPMGATFGTILHRVFELAILDIRNNKVVDKKAIINQSIIESYIDMQEEDNNYFYKHLKDYPIYLDEKLDDFLNSDLIKKVKCAKEVYPEYAFNFFVDPSEVDEGIDLGNDKIWFNGKADLVIVNDNNIEIYDYKTDHKGEYSNEELYKHLEDTYSTQQRMYCYAMMKCFKIDRKNITYHFYHLYK